MSISVVTSHGSDFLNINRKVILTKAINEPIIRVNNDAASARRVSPAPSASESGKRWKIQFNLVSLGTDDVLHVKIHTIADAHIGTDRHSQI